MGRPDMVDAIADKLVGDHVAMMVELADLRQACNEAWQAGYAAAKSEGPPTTEPFCFMSETFEVALFTDATAKWPDMFPVYRLPPDAAAQIEVLKGELLGADALHEAEIAMHNKTKEKIAKLEADAKRYRALRQMTWHASPLCVVANPRQAVKLGYYCPSGNPLDETIDLIIAAEAP
jgi:hypothetical protein